MEMKLENRREMFRTFGRTLALMGLAGFGSMAVMRQSRSPLEDDCDRIDPCGGCKILSRCELPKAVTARRSYEERNRG